MEIGSLHLDQELGLLIRYKGHESHVEVPEGVRVIGEYAFANHKDLLSVELPESLVEIGSWAFDRCERLGRIRLPDHLESIGNNAFYACYNLTRIHLPAGVRQIGESAFWGCLNLQSVELPEGLSEISHCVFKMCLKLKSVQIPESVKRIGRWSFSDCESLDGLVLPDGLQRISDHMLSGCKSLSQLELPGGITHIGEWALSGCASLKALKLPDSLESIGEWAFKGCVGLESMEIPSRVAHIGANAFHFCSGLKRIDVSADNPVYTSRDGILLSKDETTLFRFPMASELSRVDIPQGVTVIADRAFSDCDRLESVTVPESVRSIGDYAFENCRKLMSVRFEQALPEVREDTFKKCPELKLHIGLKAFNGENLFELVHRHAEDPERLLFPFVSVWSKVPLSKVKALQACFEADAQEIRLNYGPYLRLFEVVDTMEDKYQLALKRMVHAVALSPQHYEIYHLYLRNNLKKCAWHFMKRHDASAMLGLIDHGVIHAGNIDQMIELANTGRHTEVMALLLQFKSERSSFPEEKYEL